MKNQISYLFNFLLIVLTISCSNNDDSTVENEQNVSNCEINIKENTALLICIDGNDLALPNEIIEYEATFYSRNDNPSNANFSWTIESGNMEILNVENSTENSNDYIVSKSFATIRFKSDYVGNGLISVNAENTTGIASYDYPVELK